MLAMGSPPDSLLIMIEMSAPIFVRTSNMPVRVGFIHTSCNVMLLSGTKMADATRNAALEQSPGTDILVAESD